MKSELIKINKHFVGRQAEQPFLKNITQSDEAQMLIAYGRRRIGKTELLEQFFHNRHILKFEGLENGDEETQRRIVLRKLAQYTETPLVNKVKTECWLDVFELLFEHTQSGTWTIYFEELQWLACYKDSFITQLKMAWDNLFRKNPKIIIVLCGSSPSFMTKHVVHSKALYNRSQHELHLQELSIQETKLLLPKRTNREIMNTYLTIGGIPEYLKRLKKSTSAIQHICNESFMPTGYFTTEYERIFVSSLSETPQYKAVIQFLSKRKFATRQDIAQHLKCKPGGRLTDLLNEIELCGFIKKYAPYNLAQNSNLARYCIADAYLQFYFKFIQPKLADIQSQRYQSDPMQAISMETYQKWLGYGFERYCRNHAHEIAKILGFSGIQYHSGTYYTRATEKSSPGYQIDLLFDRADHVTTICEIKYGQTKAGTKIIEAFEKKLERFNNKKNKTIHKVLISAEGADKALTDRHYFDKIITLDDLMS